MTPSWRIFGRRKAGRPVAAAPPQKVPAPPVTDTKPKEPTCLLAPVEVAGANTAARATIYHIGVSHRVVGPSLIETHADLLVVTEKPANVSSDVAVAMFEDAIVGYLPAWAAGAVRLGDAETMSVDLQLFISPDGEGFRARVWVKGQESPVPFEYSDAAPPPVTMKEQAAVASAERTAQLNDWAAAASQDQRRVFEAGTVGGVHYLQTPETLAQLKREGRLDEALQLAMTGIEGAERAAARESAPPAPWCTKQAAIILRKLHRQDDEVAVLRRWLGRVPTDSPNRSVARHRAELEERLRKLFA